MLKILSTLLLTILGFVWGFFSVGAFFVAGLAGPAGGGMNLLLSLTLFLPGFLGFTTYELFNNLLQLHGEWSVLVGIFAILYGVIILLIVKEVFTRIYNHFKN